MGVLFLSRLILLRPAVETPLNELDRLLVRFVAVLGNLHGRAELEPHGAFGVKRAHVAQIFPGGEDIRLQRHWQDGDSGGFRELNADGVELRGIERVRACGLREDDHGASAFEHLFAFGQDGAEVFAGVGPADRDRVEREQDVTEERHVQQGFLHDEGKVNVLADDRVEHSRLQQAHVVPDNHDGFPAEVAQMVEAADVDASAAAFD